MMRGDARKRATGDETRGEAEGVCRVCGEPARGVACGQPVVPAPVAQPADVEALDEVYALAKSLFAEEQCDSRQRKELEHNWETRLSEEDQAEYLNLARDFLASNWLARRDAARDRARDAEADPHWYLSTACLHDTHPSCRVTCKFCDAPCICTCHKETP